MHRIRSHDDILIPGNNFNLLLSRFHLNLLPENFVMCNVSLTKWDACDKKFLLMVPHHVRVLLRRRRLVR